MVRAMFRTKFEQHRCATGLFVSTCFQRLMFGYLFLIISEASAYGFFSAPPGKITLPIFQESRRREHGGAATAGLVVS
jgi:hypothetical protein